MKEMTAFSSKLASKAFHITGVLILWGSMEKEQIEVGNLAIFRDLQLNNKILPFEKR